MADNTNTNDTINRVYGIFDEHQTISNNGVSSIIRKNHETLISASVADDFNTYRTYGAFGLAVDVDPLTTDDFDDEGLKKNADRAKVQSTGVRSIFNKLHAVPLENSDYGWRVSQNMPLLDSPSNRQKQRAMNACTVRDLVQKSKQGLLGTAMYDWSDFMYCKYLGQISNNHLITLRRYTIPVQDYIKPYGNPSAINGKSKGGAKVSTQTDNGGVPLGCMVTWLGTPGNEMSEILKYSFNMPFKEVKSSFEDNGQTLHGDSVNRNSGGRLGSGFTKIFEDRTAQRLGNMIMPGIFNDHGNLERQNIYPFYDANRAYAEVDAIKSIMMRDADTGLSFSQEFTLTFDYELRSYDGVNGKQAMLDLLGNILTVCYTQGDFWPGAYRASAHGSTYEPMSSLECMKHHDTFTEYQQAFVHDFDSIKKGVGNTISSKGGLWNTIKELANNLLGALIGGNLGVMPAVMQTGVNALLSDSAVGLWHVTIGNPCAPILSMGNMIVSDCSVEHYGPLGIDDFPTGLKVVVKLKHGKPRDKRLIERMYNGGNDRIYMPLDQSVFNLLKQADAINKKQAEGTGKSGIRGSLANTGPTSAGLDSDKSINERRDAEKTANEEAYSAKTGSSFNDDRVDIMTELGSSSAMQRIFGTTNTQAIRWAAGELNEGSPRKSSSTAPVDGESLKK